MNYFLGKNGGPSFLDMSLNWVNIDTPVEDIIMSYEQTSYYEILNLKYDSNSDYYYDLFVLLRNLNDEEISELDELYSNSTLDEKCCYINYRDLYA